MIKQYTKHKVFISIVLATLFLVLLILIANTALLIKFLKALPTCYIYKTYGRCCPGCGNTRSIIELLSGNISKSFMYNPLPVTIISLVVVHLVDVANRRFGSKKKINTPFLICVSSIILMIFYIYRFLFGTIPV